MECPFVGFRDDDEDAEEEEKQSQKAVKEGAGEQDQDFPLQAIGFPERKRPRPQKEPIIFPHMDPVIIKETRRIAALQRLGDLKSIPSAFSQEQFPFGDFTNQMLIAGLSAIMVMQGIRALRASGFSNSSLGVAMSEKRSAKGLRQAFGPSPGQGPLRGGGRGGFNLMESKFRGLLRRPKIGGTVDAGFDAFSETGFN